MAAPTLFYHSRIDEQGRQARGMCLSLRLLPSFSRHPGRDRTTPNNSSTCPRVVNTTTYCCGICPAVEGTEVRFMMQKQQRPHLLYIQASLPLLPSTVRGPDASRESLSVQVLHASRSVAFAWTPPALGRTPSPIPLTLAWAPPARWRLRRRHDGPDRIRRVVCVRSFVGRRGEQAAPDMSRRLPDRRPDVRLVRVVLVPRRQHVWCRCNLRRERVVHLSVRRRRLRQR